MNLYLLTRPSLQPAGWDEFISLIVSAPDEATARLIHPEYVSEFTWDTSLNKWMSPHGYCDQDEWIAPQDVLVSLIGTAAPNLRTPSVIHISFNAG